MEERVSILRGVLLNSMKYVGSRYSSTDVLWRNILYRTIIIPRSFINPKHVNSEELVEFDRLYTDKDRIPIRKLMQEYSSLIRQIRGKSMWDIYNIILKDIEEAIKDIPWKRD